MYATTKRIASGNKCEIPGIQMNSDGVSEVVFCISHETMLSDLRSVHFGMTFRKNDFASFLFPLIYEAESTTSSSFYATSRNISILSQSTSPMSESLKWTCPFVRTVGAVSRYKIVCHVEHMETQYKKRGCLCV